MQVTTQWMSQWFDHFNSLYFDDKLPRPVLKTGRATHSLGTFKCKRVRKWGVTRFQDFTITLSNHYDLSEHEFQSVLLHEMIHYIIAYTRLKDTSAHGIIFRGIMDRLNRDGWNIQVVHHAALKARKPQAPSTHLVVAITLKSGRRLLSAVNPRYARKIAWELKGSALVSSSRWGWSCDPWLTDKPVVRSPRGIAVDGDTFNRVCAGMDAVENFDD